MPAYVNFQNININFMSRVGVVLNGENLCFGFSTHQKQNYFVQPIGHLNIIPRNFNLNDDRDYEDNGGDSNDTIFAVGNSQT
jgi:hypothetical protein